MKNTRYRNLKNVKILPSGILKIARYSRKSVINLLFNIVNYF